MPRPNTYFMGMIITSHLKPKDSKWNQYKHSSCNWKLPVTKFMFRVVK